MLASDQHDDDDILLGKFHIYSAISMFSEQFWIPVVKIFIEKINGKCALEHLTHESCYCVQKIIWLKYGATAESFSIYCEHYVSKVDFIIRNLSDYFETFILSFHTAHPLFSPHANVRSYTIELFRRTLKFHLVGRNSNQPYRTLRNRSVRRIFNATTKMHPFILVLLIIIWPSSNAQFSLIFAFADVSMLSELRSNTELTTQ